MKSNFGDIQVWDASDKLDEAADFCNGGEHRDLLRELQRNCQGERERARE